MIELNSYVIEGIKGHAARCAPRESCGLIIAYKGRFVYKPCRNVAEGTQHFSIHREDWAEAEDTGEVVMIVHSHTVFPAEPSQPDKVACEESKLPWLIVNHPTGAMVQFEPSGYKAPLYGRQFAHGVLDCYTWIRDYYREVCGIEILDFEREDHWWKKGQNLYRDNYKKAGFVEVSQEDLKIHDVIFMMAGSNKENHAAVMVDDNIIGHHFMERISTAEVYGGYWRKISTAVVRHRNFL